MWRQSGGVCLGVSEDRDKLAKRERTNRERMTWTTDLSLPPPSPPPIPTVTWYTLLSSAFRDEKKPISRENES